MFGLFRKDPFKKLNREYDRLMEESYRLSRTNRRLADQKYAEAESVRQKMEALRSNQ